MKNIFFLLTIMTMFFASSCEKDKESEPDKNLDGAAAGAVLKAEAFKLNDKEVQCKLELMIVDERGNFVGNLKKNDLQIAGNSYYITYEVNGLSKYGLEKVGPYSAGLLLDQSGSIKNTDPLDLRIEASKVFVRFLGDKDEVALHSFKGNYYYKHQDFTADSNLIFSYLDYLSNSESGGTPLYGSAYQVTNYISTEASKENKALLLFTDGNDTNSSISMEDVIDNALDKNVEIYTIGLSNGVDIEVLAELANETGGAFMWAEDVKQLISLFGNLGDLLHGTAKYYSFEFVATTTGSWYSGNTIYASVIVTMPDGSTITVPFSIIVK